MLDKIGALGVKGGPEARKAEGIDKKLSDEVREFLKEAIKRIIRRVAEVEHSADAKRPDIKLSDLLPL